MKTEEINNSMDVIDSRDVIARIEELENTFNDLCADVQEAKDINDEEVIVERVNALIDFLGSGNQREIFDSELNFETLRDYMESDEARELKVLKALAEEGESSPDWSYGEALISDSYFEEYAEQLAEDIGAIDRDAKWPLNHIDWSAAAEQLKQDYMNVDFDGQTYWIRA